ncbi:MAG TPA: lmo0937 family membrane protein [Candidatus Avamphibacillus sp.]|nr:lmo0937 family membrane protein [Candidatus Avamphibacillus sp.]
MLWTIFIILFILWVPGFAFRIAGNLIHIILILFVILLAIKIVGMIVN